MVVSEALGIRKPHPAVLRAAVRAVGLAPAEVLFVGDTFAEDVLGARAAGVDVVWIDAHGRGAPAGSEPVPPTIRRLDELAGLLASP